MLLMLEVYQCDETMVLSVDFQKKNREKEK